MRLRAVRPVGVVAWAVGVLAWSVVACTGGGSARPAESRATIPPCEVVAKAEVPPLPFGSTPLWSDKTKGVPRYADRFALHGDSVVAISGPKGGEADRLSVMDAATGKVRVVHRTVETAARRARRPVGRGGPVLQGPAGRGTGRRPREGGDWGVLVTTLRNHDSIQKGYGLALLSGKDGSVLWRRTLVAAKKSSGHDGYVYPNLLLSDGKLAVMSLRPSSDATVADIRLIAVDTHTGKRLWTRTGVQLAAVAAGSVIAAESQDPASVSLDSGVSGTVTVLDAATGHTRWSLRGRMDTARVAAVAGGMLLVREAQGGTLKAPVLLDLTTGTQLDRMPDQTGNCASDRAYPDRRPCPVPQPRLLTVRADERRVRVAGRKPPDGTISLVRDGRIYFSGLNAPGQEVDRSGTPLVGPLPEGILDALSDKYAVFRLPQTQRYRVLTALAEPAREPPTREDRHATAQAHNRPGAPRASPYRSSATTDSRTSTSRSAASGRPYERAFRAMPSRRPGSASSGVTASRRSAGVAALRRATAAPASCR